MMARDTLRAITPELASAARVSLSQLLCSIARPGSTWMTFKSIEGELPEACPDPEMLMRLDRVMVTWPAIDWDNKTLSPRTMNGQRLSFVTRRHNVPEPDPTMSTAVDPEKIDIVLVPGLAFDPNGGRLGRGGGFYDRFLSKHPMALRIGVAFDSQVVAHVPTNSHDERVDILLTPDAIMRCTTTRESVDFRSIGPIPLDN